MADRGSASGSKSKGSQALVLTAAEQWDKHNPNSTNRQDLTRFERQLKRIELLRSMGVPDAELTLVHVVPVHLQNQDEGGPIDTMNLESGDIITTWGHERQTFYYLLIFGKGTAQAVGDMGAISELIEEDIKPQLKELHARIKRARGRPFCPPRCFDVDVDDLKVPVPLRRRRN